MVLFLLFFASVGVFTANASCDEDMQHFMNGFKKYGAGIQGNDKYASMVYYSGKFINQFGNYYGCNQLSDARYVFINFTKLTIVQTGIGLCLPASCSKSDIESFMRDLFTGKLPEPTEGHQAFYEFARLNGMLQDVKSSNDGLPFDVVFSYEREQEIKESHSAAQVIFIIIMLTLALTGFIATMLDMYQNYANKRIMKLKEQGQSTELSSHAQLIEPAADTGSQPAIKPPLQLPENSRGIKALLCFSWYTNTHKLFTLKDKIEPLDVLNGVRVMATGQVVLAHTVMVGAMMPMQNFDALIDIFESPSLAFVYGGLYAVDTFFWMSGFLMGYLMVSEMVKRGGRMKWGLVYFHRYWRIVPLVAIAVGCHWLLSEYFGSGPLWYLRENYKDPECSSYWWTPLVFLNNFIPYGKGNGCLGITWYLAVDFQFFLITPLILILYYRFGHKVGWGIILFLCILNIFMSTLLSGIYDFVVVSAPRDQDHFELMYSKPYCRCAVYAIGLASGWVVFSYKYYKDTKDVFDPVALFIAKLFTKSTCFRYAAFIVGIGIVNVIFFVQHSLWADIRHGFKSWTHAENVLWLGTQRFFWGIALTGILLPLLLGKFVYIREILGAAFWIPIARITFAIYLFHFMTVNWVYYSMEQANYFGPQANATLVVFMCCAAGMMGYCMSMLVEVPCMNLEKVILSRGPPRK